MAAVKSSYFKENNKKFSASNIFIFIFASLSLGFGIYLSSVFLNKNSRDILGNVLGTQTVANITQKNYSNEIIKFKYSNSLIVKDETHEECVIDGQPKYSSLIKFNGEKLSIQINPCTVSFPIDAIEKEMKITSLDNKIFQYILIKNTDGYIALASHQGDTEIYITSKLATAEEASIFEREIIGIIASMEISTP